MDIKVGNYVRCSTAGIKRVVEIIKEPKFFKVSHIKDEEGLLVNIGFITKVSEDKLGIIEAGDYVNGEKVKEITKNYITIGNVTLGTKDLKNINDILTREQFEARKYVFKEEIEYGQE